VRGAWVFAGRPVIPNPARTLLRELLTGVLAVLRALLGTRGPVLPIHAATALTTRLIAPSQTVSTARLVAPGPVEADLAVTRPISLARVVQTAFCTINTTGVTEFSRITRKTSPISWVTLLLEATVMTFRLTPTPKSPSLALTRAVVFSASSPHAPI
jgi:hypothetical protein